MRLHGRVLPGGNLRFCARFLPPLRSRLLQSGRGCIPKRLPALRGWIFQRGWRGFLRPLPCGYVRGVVGGGAYLLQLLGGLLLPCWLLLPQQVRLEYVQRAGRLVLRGLVSTGVLR